VFLFLGSGVSMAKLSVNLNKIALLRNARDLDIPNVLKSARTVIQAGAYGVTVHPRPDERHIRYIDAYEVAQLVRVEYPGIEYNIEGNPFTGRYMEVVGDVKPDQATLVPDEPGQNTSDHGWNLTEANMQRLAPVIDQLKNIGVRVSLFMDPVCSQIENAKTLGADRVELYTEPYARAFTIGQVEQELSKFIEAAEYAGEAGLGLNAGHDLNLENLGLFCEKMPGLLEVSIGHALISDAIDMGLAKAVKAYLKILTEADEKRGR
jgi:pyridoxine 5-phosphate synthase